MRKILIAYILILCVIFSLFSVSAEGIIKFEISTPETLPKAGEEFTVTVNLLDNPGINAIQFALSFDKELMECKEAYIGEVLEKALNVTNPSADEGAIVAAASVKELTGNGMAGEFVFTAKKDIEKFNFKLQDVEITSDKLGKLEFELLGKENEGAEDETDTKPEPEDEPVVVPLPEDDVTTNPEDGELSDFEEETIENNNPPIVSDGESSDNHEKEEIPEVKEPENETKPQEKPVEMPAFCDMSGHWAENFVTEAAKKGLFKGDDKGNFNPDANVTRAQFVTVLFRMAGSPKVSDVPPFKDTKNELDEFKNAIAWGYKNGYISGISETEFNPSGTLTREAAMKILHYYSGGQTGEEFKLYAIYDGTFKDSREISSWAKPSVYWGIYNKLISGMSDTELAPQGTATRAQLAKILVGYLDEYAK